MKTKYGIDGQRFSIDEMAGISSSEKVTINECSQSNTSCVLRISVDDGNKTRLFIKTATNDKGDNPFWNLCIREVKFYEFIIENGFGSSLNVPMYRRHKILSDGTGYYLVLNDVTGSYRNWNEIDFTNINVWKRTISGIAYLHTTLQEKIAGTASSSLAPRENSESAHTDRIKSAFARFCDDFSDKVEESVLSLLEGSIPAIESYQKQKYQRLHSGEDATITHGDLHARNVMYPVHREEYPLLIDWQFWGVDVGVLDLPHLIGTGLPLNLRRHQKDLVNYYFDELGSEAKSDYEWKDCWADYRMGIVEYLFMAVWQYSGWGWGYDRWKNTLRDAVDNYRELRCEEIVY